MKHPYIPVLLGLFAISLTACKNEVATVKDKPAVNVNVIVAEEVNFPTIIEVNGTSLSEESIDLYPEAAGKLIFLNIPDGESVKKGTLLAKINDDELQAQMEQFKVQFELAVKTEERLKKLLEVNGVNQSEYDAALSQLNEIKANIHVLKAKIDKTEIRAPFDGNLGLRLVSPGAYVSTQTMIGTLHQSDRTKIDFTVPESYANLVNKGDTIYLQTNDSNEKQKAIISAIESQINPVTRSINLRARLVSGNIRPGSFVKVALVNNESRITVPSNAIIPNANSNQVIVIKGKKPVFTNIETGERNADAVAILSGLQTGDSIVVSGVLFVRQNSVINVGKVVKMDVSGSIDSKEPVK